MLPGQILHNGTPVQPMQISKPLVGNPPPSPTVLFHFITSHFCKSSVKTFLSPGLFDSDGDCPACFNLFSTPYLFFAPELGNLYHAHLLLAHREPAHKAGLLAGSWHEHHSAEKESLLCTALPECLPMFYIFGQLHR